MRADKAITPKGNRNKTSPCQRCGKPAWGDHCRPCSFIVAPVPQRRAMRRSEWGAGDKHIAIVTTEMPTHSWWIAPTREAFQQQYQIELPRLMAVKVSGNPGFVNTVLD
jgi:ribosomal protein L37E